jgi:predicted metal-dependent peptidase
MTTQITDEEWEAAVAEAPVIDIPSLRNYLIKKCPFYTQALQRVDIILVTNKDAPSFGWTNGFRVYINVPLYIAHGKQVVEAKKTWFATPILGIAFTIMHEIGHIVFDSFGRLGHRDPKMWNIATDYQINQFVCKLMEQSGVFQTKESFTAFLKVINENLCFDPAKFEKLTSEGTYDDLYRVSVGRSGNIPGDGKSLGGDMEMPEDDSLSDEDKMDRDIVKSELSNYAEKNASKLPGNGLGFREFDFMLEPPKVNLRMVLKQITDRECTEDWGWNSRGSRMDHLLGQGMRLPVITESNPDLIKKIFFVLDSSGSMGPQQLNDAANIAKELIEKYTRQPVYFIIHTSDVVFSGDIKTHNEAISSFSGGTNFQCVIDELLRLRKYEHIEPSTIIWLSDLYAEINPTAHDMRGTCKNPNKQLKWIVSGSNVEPECGKAYYIDEVGN